MNAYARLCAVLCFICALVFMSGCAGREVVTETVEVEIPVSAPCLSKDDLPAPVPSAAESVTVDSEPGEKIKAVLVERSRLRANEKEWRAVTGGCLE